MVKDEEKMHFLTNKEFVYFFYWEMLVNTSYPKNSWKHVVNSIIDLLTYVFSTSNGPDQERYFALLQKFLRAACLVRARDGLNVIDEALEKIKKIDDLQVIFHTSIYLISNYE